MGIFGKKKAEDEDALIERLSGDPKSSFSEKSEKQGKGTNAAEIEKIGAQISAMREALQVHQERFERQSEEIGELRSAIAERERQMRDVEAKATKAADLVSEVQPEALMVEQKKLEAKIEAIKAKIENSEAISGNIIEELKKVKGSIAVFRGTEGIVALNREVQEELKNIKKVEATVERHADRVEALFSSFEKNFGDFEKMKDGIAGATDACAALKKDVEKNSASIQSIPGKDEFYNLKQTLQKTLEEINGEKSAYEKRNASIDAAFSKAVQKRDELDALRESIKKMLDEVKKEKAAHEKRAASIDAAVAKMMQKKDETGAVRDALNKALDEIKKEKSVQDKKIALADSAISKAMQKISAVESRADDDHAAALGNSRRIDDMTEVIERMAKVIARGGKCSKQR